MKKINFDYESDKITGAVGLTDEQGHQLDNKLRGLTIEMMKGHLSKPALLAEVISDEFSEEEIIMCVIQLLMNSITDIVETNPEIAYLTMNEDDINNKIDKLINEN